MLLLSETPREAKVRSKRAGRVSVFSSDFLGEDPDTSETAAQGDYDPRKVLVDGEILSTDVVDERTEFILGTRVPKNPDALIREKGMRVLDRMLHTDADVKHGYMLKKEVRASAGWSFRPAEDGNPLAEEIADFVKWNFECFCRVGVYGFLMKMWDGMRQGFKIAEKVYEVIPTGRWAGLIGLSDLVVRDSKFYSFEFDLNGRITPLGVIEGLSSTGIVTDPRGIRRLPVNKFVIFTYNANDDSGQSRYGLSEFRVLWRYYYGQLVAHSDRLRASETFSRPPIIAKVPTARFSKKEQRKISKDLAQAYNRRVTRIPQEIDWSLLETKRTDSGGHQELIQFHGEMINRGQGIGPVLGGNPVSGAAVSEAQVKAFLYKMDALGMDTSNNIMGPVIKDIVDKNWGVPLYPEFHMPRMSGDREKLAEFIEVLVQNGVVDPGESWVRPFVDVPSPETSDAQDVDDDDGFDPMDPDGEDGDPGDPEGSTEPEDGAGDPPVESLSYKTPGRVRDVFMRMGTGGELVGLGDSPPDFIPARDERTYLLEERDNGGTRVRTVIPPEFERLALKVAQRIVSDDRTVKIFTSKIVGRAAGMPLFRITGMAVSRNVSPLSFIVMRERALNVIEMREREPDGSRVIQTLILLKTRFKTAGEARRWAKRNNFKTSFEGKGVDETSTSFRFRQRDPRDFEKPTFRTNRVCRGVSIVTATLKGD